MRPFHLPLMLVVLAAVVFSGVAVAAPVEQPPPQRATQPRITWSMPRVVQSLRPGQAASVTVTLTSTVAVNGAELRVVGGLAGLLTVEPALVNLRAGTPVNVTLRMSVPANHTGARAGVVQVRAGERNLPHALQVQIGTGAAERKVEPAAKGKPADKGKPAENPGRGKGKSGN